MVNKRVFVLIHTNAGSIMKDVAVKRGTTINVDMECPARRGMRFVKNNTAVVRFANASDTSLQTMTIEQTDFVPAFVFPVIQDSAFLKTTQIDWKGR